MAGLVRVWMQWCCEKMELIEVLVPKTDQYSPSPAINIHHFRKADKTPHLPSSISQTCTKDHRNCQIKPPFFLSSLLSSPPSLPHCPSTHQPTKRTLQQNKPDLKSALFSLCPHFFLPPHSSEQGNNRAAITTFMSQNHTQKGSRFGLNTIPLSHICPICRHLFSTTVSRHTTRDTARKSNPPNPTNYSPFLTPHIQITRPPSNLKPHL